MNFTDLQSEVRNLIAAHDLFKDKEAATVFSDLGDKKKQIEAALDVSSSPAGDGYAISVWPPARGNSDSELGGSVGIDAMIVVRFEINPKMLLEESDPAAWVNLRLEAVMQSVLEAQPDAGGVRFTLAADAFELVNFDEGLVAYHIRFARFAVFGVQ